MLKDSLRKIQQFIAEQEFAVQQKYVGTQIRLEKYNWAGDMIVREYTVMHVYFSMQKEQFMFELNDDSSPWSMSELELE